jgi:hypothetical protein
VVIGEAGHVTGGHRRVADDHGRHAGRAHAGDVAGDVRQHVQAVIDDQGTFTTSGDLIAFICR